MPDPALLELIQHFASPPPAIVQPAIMADVEPFLSAYEAIADQQDRDFEVWVASAEKVKEKARTSVEAHPREFSPQAFDHILQMFDQHIRRMKRVIARMERGSTSSISPRLRRLRERSLTRQRQIYEAAVNLSTFLKSIRDEVAAQKAEAPSVAWTPNETTIAAMKEAEAGGLPRFATVADLMADLHADD